MSRMVPAREVAELLDVTPATLAQWRATGYGPPAYYVGRAVKYRAHEIEAWLDGQKCSEIDAPVAA